jgi:hypothetical protein
MGTVVLEKHTASIFSRFNRSVLEMEALCCSEMLVLTKLQYGVISSMTIIRNFNFSPGKISCSFMSLSVVCLNTALANSLMLALSITSSRPVLYL